MLNRRKKNKKDIEAWLLAFEQLIGSGCVVSLLIDEGEIKFVAAYDKHKYLDIVEPDEETPLRDLDIEPEDIKTMRSSFNDYIG